MIDLHNHILPGVDDGAADLQESIAIARQFASEGVVRVAATPHLNPERGNAIDAESVAELVRTVQTAAREQGVDLAIEPGHELFLTPVAPTLLKEGVASGLGHSKSVLVELPFESRPLYLEDTLFQLQIAGYAPILAHPERYSFVRADPTSLDDLLARGITMQLTAPALLGQYGREIRQVAEKLLQRGAYAVASSDRHHPGSDRSLAAVHERITALADEALADLLLKENPARVLDDRELVQPEIPAPSPRSSLFSRLVGRDDSTP